MALFLIPVLCTLAVLKITLQSAFSKTDDADIESNIFCNGIMFATAALIFLPFILKNGISSQTLIFGIIMGVLSFAFQIFYICAFSCGEMSLTVIINNFSMILPMSASFVLFNEHFGRLNLIGAMLALVSFVLTTSSKKNDKTEKNRAKWIFFTALVFITNGMISIDQKIYSAYAENFRIFEFVAAAYSSATLLALISFSIIRHKSSKKKIFRFNRKHIVTFCVSGGILGLFQCLNTYAASVIDGTVLYSTCNCGISLLSVLIGKILFKEHMSKKQYIGLFVGITAIILFRGFLHSTSFLCQFYLFSFCALLSFVSRRFITSFGIGFISPAAFND